MQEEKILQSHLCENRNCGHIEPGNCFVTLCICALNTDSNFVSASGRRCSLPTSLHRGNKCKK